MPERRAGADAVLETLLAGGVDTCFANPGTSELGFVAALDRQPDMRAVLCLAEGVATGAADGFGRMRDAPAATLLHLGPGLANGLACLHNARRARTPLVNLVGDHATYHRRFDAPLTTDLATVAAPFPDWFRSSERAEAVAGDTAAAVEAARAQGGGIATLALPADTCWDPTDAGANPAPPPAPRSPEPRLLEAAARLLRNGRRTLLLLGGKALRDDALAAAARIARKTGAALLAPTHNARIERGAGRIAVDRLPYPVDAAVAALARFEQVILVGARSPVAFFAYPGRPSELLPAGCTVHELAAQGEDACGALEALADELGAGKAAGASALRVPGRPDGALDPATIAAILAREMPENAIIAEDAVTSGRGLFPPTATAAPHSWLQTTGGAIGHGLPMATGAAVACSDRPVICLQADGAGMYSLQALWTQAREGLNVTTVIFANRSYAILRGEFRNLGIERIGASSDRLTTLDQPSLDWCSLARGMGVPAARAETVDEFEQALRRGVADDGPHLVEALIP